MHCSPEGSPKYSNLKSWVATVSSQSFADKSCAGIVKQHVQCAHSPMYFAASESVLHLADKSCAGIVKQHMQCAHSPMYFAVSVLHLADKSCAGVVKQHVQCAQSPMYFAASESVLHLAAVSFNL